MKVFEKEFGVSIAQLVTETAARIENDKAVAKAVMHLLPLCDGIAQTVFVPLADGRIASVRVKVIQANEQEAGQ